MTKLLSLLNQVFGNQTKANDLEQYINSRNPNSHQQVEELTREYLYNFKASWGLLIKKKLKNLLNKAALAWAETRKAYVNGYINHRLGS